MCRLWPPLSRMSNSCMSDQGSRNALLSQDRLSAIIVQDAFLAKRLFQYFVFSPQVLDIILLMAINPTRDDEEE